MNKFKWKGLVLFLLVVGCQQQADDFGLPVFELKASNASDIKVYPVLSSGENEQGFGVVSVGKSKTIGFSPFRVGDKVTVTWSEGKDDVLYKKDIDTTPLIEDAEGIYTLNFVYLGQKKWAVRILDKEGNQLKKITR